MSTSPKISSGVLRGLSLETPRGESTRPTGAKVRAAVMNSLQARFAEARFLDLFAGSGAVGLEALSRGASGCVFVENGKAALVALEKNGAEARRRFAAQKLDVPSISFERMDAMVFLRRSLPSPAGQFDVIWADPPYNLVPEIASELLDLAVKVLADDGMVILESRASWQAKESGGSWRLTKDKTYGETRVSFFEKNL